MKNKGVTLLLLWQEYRERHGPDGYSYAQFCHRYRVWQGGQKRSMRQTHRAGEKLFVDYCGPTMPVVNPDTGEYIVFNMSSQTLRFEAFAFAASGSLSCFRRKLGW